MKTKFHIISSIVAASLVATILGTTTFATAAASWVDIDSATAEQQDDNMSKLSITAADDIPRKAELDDAVAGFGWANVIAGDDVDVVVATIHPTFRDSAQNPDSWHLHAANLAFIDADSACVQEFYANPQGGIAIQGDTLRVNLENAQMPFEASDVDVAGSFVINPVAASADCPAVFSGFALQVDFTDVVAVS